MREAVFNSLYSAGAIDGVSVLDLFAGSGAMGLEALSRGATDVTFVESSAAALGVLRSNIETLGFSDSATVLAVDALRYIDNAESFDVVVLDPPYDFDGWADLLTVVKAEVIVIESNRSIELGDRWASFKQGQYGATVVELARAVD